MKIDEKEWNRLLRNGWLGIEQTVLVCYNKPVIIMNKNIHL